MTYPIILSKIDRWILCKWVWIRGMSEGRVYTLQNLQLTRIFVTCSVVHQCKCF